MEGISTITYKNKSILRVDYSIYGNDKKKAIELVQNGIKEYMKYPLNSVLSLVNVTNLRFDTEVMNAFKEGQDKSLPYEKKVAVVGLNTLQRIAYNFIIGSHKDKIKAFESEQEAKEWLVAN